MTPSDTLLPMTTDNEEERNAPILSPRRQQFVDAYVATGNGSFAARAADPPFAEPAAQSAYQLLRSIDIQDAVARKASDAARANELSPEWVISRFMDISEHAMNTAQMPAAVQALRELGRVQGLFVDRTELDIRAAIAQVSAEQGLDPDELEAEVKRLAADSS